jgi:PPOX class probable F420-dependent enzyme
MDTTHRLPSPTEHRFLEGRRVAHLATADRAGNPHVVPVCFALAGAAVYITIDEKPKRGPVATLKRLRNIAENPSVALVADHYDEDWSRLGWVMLRGPAEILVAGDEHAIAQARLVARYPQLEAMAIAQHPVIAIRIARTTSWGNFGTRPSPRKEAAMRIGVFYFPTHYGIEPAELARALEERGFDSLFLCEHTHIPTSRRSPFPGGGELPKRYVHTHDPFVALSFAAAATKTLLLGTGVCLVPQRDPIITAKTIASLDQLSGGRFVFGIGGGWNVEEMENHGARYDTRFKLMRERVLAMKALWTEEEASFHGDFVNFDPVWCYPKPLQQPHPPILLGGETDYTLKRVVEFCDGWLPRAGAGFDPAVAVDRLRRAADAAGRDFSSLGITVFRAPSDPAKLAAYREAGIQRGLLEVPDLDRDEILRTLDRLAPLTA